MSNARDINRVGAVGGLSHSVKMEATGFRLVSGNDQRSSNPNDCVHEEVHRVWVYPMRLESRNLGGDDWGIGSLVVV